MDVNYKLGWIWKEAVSWLNRICNTLSKIGGFDKMKLQFWVLLLLMLVLLLLLLLHWWCMQRIAGPPACYLVRAKCDIVEAL